MSKEYHHIKNHHTYADLMLKLLFFVVVTQQNYEINLAKEPYIIEHLDPSSLFSNMRLNSKVQYHPQ